MIDFRHKNVCVFTHVVIAISYLCTESTHGNGQSAEESSNRDLDALSSLIQAHPEKKPVADAKAALTEEEFNSTFGQYPI
jgi:hypothetical protein